MKKLLNRLFSRMVITCLLVAAQLIFFMVEVFKLQQYYVLVAAILHLLSFIAVMHLLLKDVNPSIKLAWIVPILMFPGSRWSALSALWTYHYAEEVREIHEACGRMGL